MKHVENGMEIDVYPVGVLAELLFAYRIVVKLGKWGEAWNRLKRIPGMWYRRNSWNGYLAEPCADIPILRCGHGWTKRRALADLRRHLAELQLSEV